MKQSSKCALGGIMAALSLVILISVAVIPFLTYALPAAAGFLIVLTVIEIDKKWAFGVYAAVAILGLLLIPDKEVAVMYAAFFGYYPILKAVYEQHLPAVVAWVLKCLTFLVTIAGSYYLMIKLMGLEIDEIKEFGLIAVPALLGAGLLAFVIYDIAISKMVLLYDLKWRRRFRRFFH